MLKIILLLGFLNCCITTFSQEYDAELVAQETQIEFINNKLNKKVFYEIRINKRSGEKYTRISIPYSKLVSVYNIEAYIKDSYGKVVKRLKNNEIIERSSISDISLYEDDFVKEFSLKHNAYPYTIAYSYQSQQSDFLHIESWTPVINGQIPTLHASLKLTVPLDYQIAYHNTLVEEPLIKTNVTQNANEIEYQWETCFKNLVKPEAYSPLISNFMPTVSIIPVQFRFDKPGSLKDWTSYGNWQYSILQGLNDLPDSEKSKIRSLIADISDDKEKIKRLFHYLQDETRYINVTIETGGMKPYPASYVARNRYGDCKALTNYFKSALDLIQIPSYYAKVNAGNPIEEINKEFPSQQFNHVILYIPLKNEDIWLDCTSDGPFEYIGTFTQNRDAFIVSMNNSRFINTPKLSPVDVLETRKIEVKYHSSEALARFENIYKGELYEAIFSLEKDYNETEKSIIVRNNLVEKGFHLNDYSIANPIRDSIGIKLTYSASSQNIYRQYGNEILVSNVSFSLPDFEKPQARKLPVQIDYPIFKVDTIIYEIPFGFKPNQGSDTFLIKSKYGAYQINICEDKNNMKAVKSLLINQGKYPVSEYNEFYTFINQVAEFENKTIISFKK